MSDVFDDLRAVREYRAEKKRANGISSKAVLQGCKIPFIEFNNGVHLRVACRFDFWPTTGKYRNLKTGDYGRGVFNLLKELRNET